MVVSKVITILLRSGRTVCATKKVNISTFRRPNNVWCLGPVNYSQVRKMSSNIEALIQDPARHFDYNELVKKIENKNAVIIDVREHTELKETGTIPGSINIPLGELAKALGEMSSDEFKKQYNATQPKKDTEIIFSCRSGVRSLKALRTGLELGYLKAGNFKGGWLEWAEKHG